MEADNVASDLQAKLSQHGTLSGSRPSPAAEDRTEVQTGDWVAPWLSGAPTSKERGRPTTVDGSSLRQLPVPGLSRPHSTGNAGTSPRRTSFASFDPGFLPPTLQDPRIWSWHQDAPRDVSLVPTPVLLDSFSVSFGNRMRQVSTQESRDSVSMRRARGRTPINLRDSNYQQLGTALGAAVDVTQGARRVKVRPGGFVAETSDEAVARLAIASPRQRYFSHGEQTAAIYSAAEAQTLAATARARPSPFAYRHDTLQVLPDLIPSCTCTNASVTAAGQHPPTISDPDIVTVSRYHQLPTPQSEKFSRYLLSFHLLYKFDVNLNHRSSRQLTTSHRRC
jgi:hypothetical protein